MYYDINQIDPNKEYTFIMQERKRRMEELTTLNLTIDELDELIAAESHMYMDYDDERSEQYNESIRKYNDKVDALLNKLKAAYKEAKEND